MSGYAGRLLAASFVLDRAGQPRNRAAGEALQPALRAWAATAGSLGPASPIRALVDAGLVPLLGMLGFTLSGPMELDDRHAWLRCLAYDEPVLCLAVPWGAALDAGWRPAVVRAVKHGATWCLLFNGRQVRLLHAARLHARRYAEIDLEHAADDATTAAVLRMLCHADALGAPATASHSLISLTAESDRFAATVCRALRHGVLTASGALLQALVQRERSGDVSDAFEQSLTLVYRLLFIFFAEGRGLVPMWHPLYRHSYSAEALRDAALARDTVGLWDTMRAMARLAHTGCHAGGLQVTAFNGRLFAPRHTPLVERRHLDEAAAREAVIAISTRQAGDGVAREPIAYADLGVEQLGAVYETLLDYEPRIEPGHGRRRRVSLQPGSGVRKATGTFYTPRALVEYLVADTLAPLASAASPEQILSLRVLDPSMGSGAFLVGACRYLASALEAALVAHGRCHATDIGPAERAGFRRVVAERCLYGVDINPTAVQLARLSLWLTTLAADRPLTFLDHHLRVGDSLAGTWLSQLRRPPVVRRSRTAPEAALPLFPDTAPDAALRQALPVRFMLAAEPNDTPAQVRAKERALAGLFAPTSPLAQWSRVADAWCASWLASPAVPASAFADLSDAILTGQAALPPGTTQALLARTSEMARRKRPFHWELQFPEVFFDADGTRRPDAGFDAIVGNPPWDMVRADDGRRGSEAPLDAAALVRFARDSGVYEVRAEGQVNRYQLFVERAVTLTRPGGRIGLVLPSGMLADAGSAALRRWMFSRTAVERVVGFDNRAAAFTIHRSVKFVLLSATAGRPTREIACRFGETDPATLKPDDGAPRSTDAAGSIRITPALLERVSGDDYSVPDLRTAADLAVLERASALFPRLDSPDGWHATFGRELNATEDRPLLRTGRDGWPVFEGKHIAPFRVHPERVHWTIDADTAVQRLGSRALQPRLAYRDIASPTNRLTLIAAVLPARSVSTHTLFCLKAGLPLESQQVLCAVLNSLVINFLVRLRVSTHVTTAIVQRLPVPTSDDLGPWRDELRQAAHVLSTRDDRASTARLNAILARVYQLDATEFRHVLNTFPLIERADRDAMLAEFTRF
ncbi:MAG: N-6 DNA methylase [Vicinamibacterales bacterium]